MDQIERTATSSELRNWIITLRNGQKIEFHGGWNDNGNNPGLGELVRDFENYVTTNQLPNMQKRYNAYTSADNTLHGIINIRIEEIVSILQIWP